MVFGMPPDAGDREGGPRTRWSRRSAAATSSGLGATLLTGGALSGCANRSSGTTRVRMWSWLTGMDRYVAAFNSTQRDVHVELSVIAAASRAATRSRPMPSAPTTPRTSCTWNIRRCRRS